MLYSTPSTAGYQLAGLKTLLLAPWSGASYAYASAACSTITNFAGLTGWERFPCERNAGCEFGEQPQRGKLGKVSPQLITLAQAGLSAAQRTALDTLLDAGPLVALCQGYDLNWWLYGQDRGLRLLNATVKGGTFGGASGHSLALVGTQDAPARLVAQSRINLLFNINTVFTSAPA